jgi:hypothetical protein
MLITQIRRYAARLSGVMLMVTSMTGACAQNLPRFDFSQEAAVREWQPTHDVASLRHTPEGMVIAINGGDPYIHGPARDFPAGQMLWMRVRLKSDQAGAAQIFYFNARKGTNEPDSVRFNVPAGVWHEAKVPVPAFGTGQMLRFDPPGTKGVCIIASISFEARSLLKEPEWVKPVAPTIGGGAVTLNSGALRLAHSAGELGGFELWVDNQRMGFGHTKPMLGYLMNGEPRWMEIPTKAQVTRTQDNGAEVRVSFRDRDGGEWVIAQRFKSAAAPGVKSAAAPGVKSAAAPGAFDVETQVTVNQDRKVIYLPMLLVLPGAGAFGGSKNQAVFAGLEYLDKNEPSSSEADIIGPGSKRQVPDTLRIAFPLMAIQQNDRYIGLIWEMTPAFSAVFDSPDRLFKSGGHVMGVIFPHSDGTNRVEGSLLPYDGETLASGKPLTLRATLIGGKGQSIIPAVQQYVALRGLPPVPETGMDVQAYAAWAGGGWLDSKIRSGDLFRHAYWPGFSGFAPGPAADAATYMDWSAIHTRDPAQAKRLREQAKQALAHVEPGNWNGSGVSHVQYPVESLLYGHVAENVQNALHGARELLKRFEPDGRILYRPSPGGLDYGRTHFEPDANGLTAQVVDRILEAASLSGDAELLKEGIRVLRALDRFMNTVPRGAQTWEVPLHTPDILACAHLVRAYTLGYEMTGERAFLEKAKYWAWTGVPFTYLVNPTPNPVGLYATTPVFGATQWVAPNWMGLPVQWCGLVYSDALYRLIRHDPAGPWKQLADGITASGIQQSFDRSDPDLQALLPDSFSMRSQTRNAVAINPGTVQANAARLYGKPDMYDFMAFRRVGLMVHAPGTIRETSESAGRLTFSVQGWLDRPCYLLIVGFKQAPRVRINGRETPLAAPHQYLAETGRLILRVEGSPKIEITTR